ncbi:MAG TPA: VOC family protein [Chitinophagaceae bacterium]|nr:VOC family protein [Chitinophagaceae bacterium]
MSDHVLTKPNVTKAVPLFAVANMENSLNFYSEGIGFTMTEKWIDEGKIRWCWLQLGEVAVMLQEFRREGHDSWKPEGKLGEGVSICFICNDAISIYRDLISRGINATRPFVGNGMWVTGCSDPDGYRLDFESFTDVPEETILKDI